MSHADMRAVNGSRTDGLSSAIPAQYHPGNAHNPGREGVTAEYGASRGVRIAQAKFRPEVLPATARSAAGAA